MLAVISHRRASLRFSGPFQSGQGLKVSVIQQRYLVLFALVFLNYQLFMTQRSSSVDWHLGKADMH
jgi:hypothetical protein